MERNKIRWYIQGKKEIDTNYEDSQLLHLLDKDFKSTVFKMHKELKKTMNEGNQENDDLNSKYQYIHRHYKKRTKEKFWI